METSNPELYAYLMSFEESCKDGIDAFKKAMRIKSSTMASTPPSPHMNPFNSNNDLNFTKADKYVAEHKRRESFQFDENQSYSGLLSTMLTASSHTNKTEGFGYSLLRFPFLGFVSLMIAIELIFYIMVRQFVVFWEYAFVWTGELRKIKEKLRSAKDYETWKKLGLELDSKMGKDEWRKEAKMPYYDHELIGSLNRKMKKLVKEEKVDELMEILLQGGLKSNVGNIENHHLYSNTYYGTKDVVESFYKQVEESLEYIGNHPNLDTATKKQFFKDAFRSYGRSALCLSGGACLAYFHFGVVRTLIENDMLPKIITGTSAGSMIAAMTACRTNEELLEIFKPETHSLINPCSEPFSVKFTRLLKTGALFSATNFAKHALWVTLGHTTFLEAYQKTGKILNITAVPYDSYSPAKLFNYISTPNVVIWSAVVASSAVPGVLNPITLMIKKPDGTLEPYLSSGVKWRDGSLKTDIPLEALKSFFNVNYSIVSQVNPHIAVFYFNHRGSVGHPAANRYGKGWRGGFLASSIEHFLKLDLKKWLRVLRDLELLPHFMQQDWSYIWLQKFDGSVTILPKVSLISYLNVFKDPDYNDLSNHLINGAAKTWPILHMVDNRIKIEKKIFYWLHQLFEQPGTKRFSDQHETNHLNRDSIYSTISAEPDLPANAPIQPNGSLSPKRNVNGKSKSAASSSFEIGLAVNGINSNGDLPDSNRNPVDFLDHLLENSEEDLDDEDDKDIDEGVVKD